MGSILMLTGTLLVKSYYWAQYKGRWTWPNFVLKFDCENLAIAANLAPHYGHSAHLSTVLCTVHSTTAYGNFTRFATLAQSLTKMKSF